MKCLIVTLTENENESIEKELAVDSCGMYIYEQTFDIFTRRCVRRPDNRTCDWYVGIEYMGKVYKYEDTVELLEALEETMTCHLYVKSVVEVDSLV